MGEFLVMSSIRTVAFVAASIGLSVGAACLKSAAIQAQAIQAPPTKEAVRNDVVPTELTYPQVYATPDGETHFREVTVPLRSEATAPPAQPVPQSGLQPATTIRHAAFPAGWGIYDRDHNIFHNPSSVRFVTVRRGIRWIRTSDGVTRRFQAGDVVEVLDVAPSKVTSFGLATSR
jgi:hypothetical protein